MTVATARPRGESGPQAFSADAWRQWVQSRPWASKADQTDRLLLLLTLIDFVDATGTVQATCRELGEHLRYRSQTVLAAATRLETFGVCREIGVSENDGFYNPTIWHVPLAPPGLEGCDTTAPLSRSTSSSSSMDFEKLGFVEKGSPAFESGAVLSPRLRLDLEDRSGLYTHRGLGPHARLVVDAAVNGDLPRLPAKTVEDHTEWQRPGLQYLTPGALADLTGCSLRTAQRLLKEWSARTFVRRVVEGGVKYLLPRSLDRDRVQWSWKDGVSHAVVLDPTEYMTSDEIGLVQAAGRRQDEEAAAFGSRRGTLRSTWPADILARNVTRVLDTNSLGWATACAGYPNHEATTVSFEAWATGFAQQVLDGLVPCEPDYDFEVVEPPHLVGAVLSRRPVRPDAAGTGGTQLLRLPRSG